MIIACPACTTRYAVPDSAIGVDGRTVRCAKCRHSWFQDGPIQVAPPPPAPEPEPDVDQAPPAPEPVAAPVAVEAATAPPVDPEPADPEPPEPEPEPADYSAPPPLADESIAGRDNTPTPSVYDDSDYDDYSSFAHEPPFRARRNPARMWTIAASLFAVVSLSAIGAVWYYGLPDWVPLARPTFAEAQAGLVLEFPPNRQDRRTLPNGTEFFGASGTIRNVGRETRSVPSLLIVLRDGRERIVYSWEVAAPKRSLAPGESVTVNEAVTDVPKSAKFAEIGWKPA